MCGRGRTGGLCEGLGARASVCGRGRTGGLCEGLGARTTSHGPGRVRRYARTTWRSRVSGGRGDTQTGRARWSARVLRGRHASRWTRSPRPPAPRHPGFCQGTQPSAAPRAGPAPALRAHCRPKQRTRAPVRRVRRVQARVDMAEAVRTGRLSEQAGCPNGKLSERAGCPNGHIWRTWRAKGPGCPNGHLRRTRCAKGPGCPNRHLRRTRCAKGPGCPKGHLRADMVCVQGGRVRLSAQPTAAAFSANGGAGGPASGATESSASNCVVAAPDSDRALLSERRPACRTPGCARLCGHNKPDPPGPCDVVRVPIGGVRTGDVVPVPIGGVRTGDVVRVPR